MNYEDYLNSYSWKALKEKKLADECNCSCCNKKATTVHHLSYERLGRENEDDIVSICDDCHQECHYINGEKIENNESELRARFHQVREKNKYLGREDVFLETENLTTKKEFGFHNLIPREDGIIIDTPFEDNYIKGELVPSEKSNQSEYALMNDQENAYQNIVNFIEGQKDVFILKGAAGTGKTTLLKQVKEYLVVKNIPYFFGAPTGKATYILKEKLDLHDELTFGTIFSILYKIKDSIDKGNKYVNFFTKQDLLENKVYIIDESSLINYKSQLDSDEYQKNILNFGTGSLLKDLIDSKKSKTTKIIFVGDNFQLPPVREDTSKALSSYFIESKFGLNTDISELTEIKRQRGESGVLKFSHLIRSKIERNDFKPPLIEANNDVIILNKKEDLLKNFSENLSNSVIISYTNKKILEYNNAIRKEVKRYTDIIEVGDKLMISKNIYLGTEQFLNGEIVEVLSIGDTEIRENIYVGKDKNDLRFLDVVLKRDYGEDRVHHLKLVLNSLDSDNGSGEDIVLSKFLFSDFEKRKLYSSQNPNGEWYKTKKGGQERYYKSKENIDEDNKEFYIELREDKYFNALEIKYGYAITCHKSQGSEWDNVFIDIDDYCHNKASKDFYNFLYTAVTRAKHKAYIFNLDKLWEKGVYDDYASKFGIQEDFINDFIDKIGTILKSYSYDLNEVFIEKVVNKDWKVMFVFSNGNSKAHMTFNYNKKGFTGKAQLHNKDNLFTNNIKDLLLKHNIIKDAY